VVRTKRGEEPPITPHLPCSTPQQCPARRADERYRVSTGAATWRGNDRRL